MSSKGRKKKGTTGGVSSTRILPFILIMVVAGGMSVIGYYAERDTHCDSLHNVGGGGGSLKQNSIQRQQCTICDSDVAPRIVEIPGEVVIEYKKVEPDPHNMESILSVMRYWKSSRYSRQTESTGKYLLIDRDCGGFNNIRMAFEYHIIWAWLTHRTLVLPPVVEWYLLDFGPIKSLAADNAPVIQGGTSKFSDYFDMEGVRGAVPVISHMELWEIPEFKKHLPSQFQGSELYGMYERLDYFAWLYNDTNPLVNQILFKGTSQFLYWPNKESVLSSSTAPDQSFIDGRTGTEVASEWLTHPVMYYPNCEDNMKYRSLTQVAVAVAFADPTMTRAMLSLLRDNIHFKQQIFDLAAEGVAEIGMYKYSSLHVRRNDLQYKEVFMDAATTYSHIKALVNKDEVLYLATDEFDADFFKPIETNHRVWKLQDLKVFPKIPRKLLGMVELVICAMGRRFFGTQHSTFTSYVHRLRGYMKAPDTNVYFHTFEYNGDAAHDSKLRPAQIARNYKEEFDIVWEMIEED